VRSLEEINAKWSNEVKGLPVEKEEKDNLLRKLEEEMKKELASVEGEKKCVRGEEAKKREDEKSRLMIQDLEEKDSLREDAAKKREEEKRRLVMKIQDLEEGRKLIASMEQEQETDSLLKLSEDRRNDVEEVNRTLREELAQLKISL
jgi:hypothetical protein